MLFENVRGASGKNIADNSAAGAGNHSHKNEQKGVFITHKKGGFNSDGGENSKAEGIHEKHDFIINSLFFKEYAPHRREEKNRGNRGCNKSIDRILKCCGRGVPKHKVADHSAADGGYDSEGHDAENIHLFRKPDHCAGKGKGNGADYFKY